MMKVTLDTEDMEYIAELVENFYSEITAECIEYYGKTEEAYAMRDVIIEKLSKR